MVRISPDTKADLLHRLPGAERRRAIRVAAGLSMADIAHDRGVTVQAVAGWERGSQPSPEHLDGYVRLLEKLAVYETAGVAS